MAQRIAGIAFYKVNGRIYPLRGNFTVSPSALERAGLRDLKENQRVSYDVAMNKGKTSAANLKVLDEAA